MISRILFWSAQAGLQEGVGLLFDIPILELRWILGHPVALQPQSILKPRTSRAVGRELIGETNLDEVGDEADCRLVLLSEQHRQRGMRCQ